MQLLNLLFKSLRNWILQNQFLISVCNRHYLKSFVKEGLGSKETVLEHRSLAELSPLDI